MDFFHEDNQKLYQLNRTKTNLLPTIQKYQYAKSLNLSLREEKSISLPYLNGSISARSLSNKHLTPRQTTWKASKKDPLPLKPSEFLLNYQSMLNESEKEEIFNCDLISYYPFAKQRRDSNERDEYEFEYRDHINYRFEMMELLGKGSFGLVVRCFDHQKKEYCALKILTKKKRFQKQGLVEVNILNHLKQFNCPSIVQIKESFVFRCHLCISFELLRINLYELIKKNHYQGFSIDLVKRFVKSILQGLALLYQEKIIHCDLKPENLLLKEKGSSAIKLIDFGSSCFQSEIMYTYIQSRYYRAPEIVLGVDYTVAIDMWSLACILVELYTGYPLFPGENEQDQLSLIVQLIGLPPMSFLQKAKRRKIFFNSKGILRSLIDRSMRKRSPSSRCLEEIVRTTNEDLLDFVRQCLKWNPDERLKANEAIHHRFVSMSN